MTKLEFAQLAANLTTAAVTRKVSRDYMNNNTTSPEIVSEVSSALLASVVAEKTKPATDELVRKAAIKLSSLRKK